MKTTEYIPLAIRTESTVIVGGNRRQSRLLQAAVGVCTEIIRFYDSGGSPNETEKLGDICRYLAIATDEIGAASLVIQSGGRQSKSKREEFRREVLQRAGAFLDAERNQLFYGKEPQEATYLVMQVFNLWQSVANLSAACGHEFGDVLDASIRKLHASHPEKFTAENAPDRNTEAARPEVKP